MIAFAAFVAWLGFFLWWTPALVFSLWLANGRRWQFVSAVWLFLAAAVLMVLSLTRIDNPTFGDSLLTLAAAPAYGVIMMVQARLFVALAVCAAFACGVLFLLARIAGARGYAVALVMGALMVPAALAGQGAWTLWRMDVQSSRAKLECITQAPFRQIVAETRFYGFYRQDFSQFHGIAKRKDGAWYWSFGNQYWMRHHPEDDADGRDLLDRVRC